MSHAPVRSLQYRTGFGLAGCAARLTGHHEPRSSAYLVWQGIGIAVVNVWIWLGIVGTGALLTSPQISEMTFTEVAPP